MDAMWIFIFAHLEWLVYVDERLRSLLDNNVDRQRRLWLQALGNGLGSKAVAAIFSQCAEEFLHIDCPSTTAEVPVNPKSSPAKEYCSRMNHALRHAMLSGDNGLSLLLLTK